MNFEIVYPKELGAKQREKNAVVVDIREPKEFYQGHYKGAINFPIGGKRDIMNILTKKRYYILYCEHGGSSMQLARKLGMAGFRVATVVGGYEAMKKI